LALSLCLALGAAPNAKHARAEPSGFTLHYEGPTGCSSRPQVERRLGELLGEEPKPEPPLVARVNVRAVGAAFKLVYEAQVAGSRSHRTLTLDTCEAVTEAAALLLLLTLDPSAAATLDVSNGAPPSSGPSNEPPSVGTRVTTAPLTPVPTPEQASSARASASRKSAVSTVNQINAVQKRAASDPNESRAAAAGGWQPSGWLLLAGAALSELGPSVALGGTLEAGIAVGGLRLGAGLGYLRATDVALAEPEGARLRVDLLRLRGLGTYLFETGEFRYGPWLSLGAERVAARVDGIREPRPGHTTFASAALGAAVNLRLSERWEAGARLGAVVPWKRPEFRVIGIPGVLHRPGPVGLDAAVGILWAWGSQ
jgi:hypothetical protein